MKYRTKVREMEAIRFNGTNGDEINKLTKLRFEVMGDWMSLLCRGGLVNIGDWVGVEDGKVKILGDAEIQEGYEVVGQACEFDE